MANVKSHAEDLNSVISEEVSSEIEMKNYSFGDVKKEMKDFTLRVETEEAKDDERDESSRKRGYREKAEFVQLFGRAMRFPKELETEAKRKKVLSDDENLMDEPFDTFTKTLFGEWADGKDKDGKKIQKWTLDKKKQGFAAIPRVFYNNDINFEDVEKNADKIEKWPYPKDTSGDAVEKEGYVAIVEQDYEDRGILAQRLEDDRKACSLITDYLADEFDLETNIPADVVEDEGINFDKDGFEGFVPLLGQFNDDGSICVKAVLKKPTSWTRSLVISLNKEAVDWKEKKDAAAKKAAQPKKGPSVSKDKLNALCA